MFFGTREKRIEMGSFNSDKCEKCGKGQEYKFIKITKFFVAFFVNLIPLSSSYEYVCDECGVIECVDKDAGKALIRNKFGYKQGGQTMQVVLKIFAFLLVIAAAIVLPLMLIKADVTNPQALKDLVSDDGVYSIQNDDGDISAIVEIVDGEKSLIFFDDVSVLVGEDGANGDFTIHEHYQEAAGDKQIQDGASLVIHGTKLERILDDVGMLKDKYDTPIRSYYYDIANESLGYAMGISDLTTIEYTAGKATYFYNYYLSDTDTQNYAVVLHLSDKQKVTATFVPMLSGGDYDQLASVSITDIQNGRVLSESVYNLDENAMSVAFDSGISIMSTADEFNALIEQSESSPVYLVRFEYYKNTQVITAIDMSTPDELGIMQTVTQNFDVTKKSGYYIQREQLS